jgi:hypothetical protein
MVVIFYIIVVFCVSFLMLFNGDRYKSPRIVFSAAGDSEVRQRYFCSTFVLSYYR